MTSDSSASSTLSSFSRSSLSRSPANSSLCSSPNSFSSGTDVMSFVPFVWEERPGVSKLEKRKLGGGIDGPCPLFSDKPDSTVSELIVPLSGNSLVFPPLRPPPRLQKLSGYDPPRRCNDVNGARANVISQSLSRRKQQRQFKSEDDPFWLAMKVCTNEGTGNFDRVSKGMNDNAPLLKRKDQQSPDFLVSFKDLIDRENRLKNKNVRSRVLRSTNFNAVVGTVDKQAHARHSSGKRVVPPTSHGKGGQVTADAEVSSRSAESRTGIVALAVLKKSKDRQSSHRFVSDRQELGPTAAADGRKGIRNPVKQYSPQPVEVSCGLRVKLKQPSHKQLIPDFLGCKSVNAFFDSVTDPSIYKGGRASPINSRT